MKKTGNLLEGKTAIVTGSGRGIGKAIAIAYAREGANVCCTARSINEITETERLIERGGGSAIAVMADLTKAEAVHELFKSVTEKYGGLDVLVANAGGSFDTELVEDSDPNIWFSVIERNLSSAYLCLRAAVPYLKQRGGGKIITIGSGMGHQGVAGNSAYACAKAGLWMLTQVLAQEVKPYNISVNELIPGLVNTSMHAPGVAQSIETSLAEWLKEPEEVTPMAVFLASQPLIGPTAQSFSLMRR